MIDRGIKKWQPFNSCFSSKEILREINNSKIKKEFPSLSDDQIYIIEEKIKDAYVLGITIKLKYFYNGNIFTKSGKITYINFQDKKIYLDKDCIFLRQILKIY